MSVASISGRNRIARQIANGIPPLNSFRSAEWHSKIIALGGKAPSIATKIELYKIWRNLIGTNR